MDIFAKAFGPILGFIFKYTQNYGISIILFTILVKLFLLPLAIKQVKSSKAMAEIQPKIKEIQTKYAKDKEKQNQLIMELYKDSNMNPLAGCLPALIQLPIILGLFTALRDPLTYVFGGNVDIAETAIHQSFLWMNSLSQPDLVSNILSNVPDSIGHLAGLLPLISALLTYWSMVTIPAPQVDPNDPSAKMANPMGILKYVMPIMIYFYGTSFTSGIVLYWTVSNVFSIIQQKYLNAQTKPIIQ